MSGNQGGGGRAVEANASPQLASLDEARPELPKLGRLNLRRGSGDGGSATFPGQAPKPSVAPADPAAKQKPWYSRSYGRPVAPEAVMSFSRQMSSFLEAGISILEALEIVAEETASDEMRAVILEIRDTVRRGASFADAVGKHPKVFPGYYRAMVVSAEFTGRLDLVMAQLATYMERDIAAKRQIRSALTYPVMILVVAVVAMIVMAVFVLPKFSGLYRSLGAKLPLPTKMLLGFTDFMGTFWPMLLGGMVLTLLGGMVFIGGERNKVRRDKLTLKLPIIGNLFHLISIERFCRVLSALATAGVPLPDAIQVSADSTNNSIFRTKMQEVRETLTRGGGLSAPMVETGLFPIAARQMIRVGERTGSLGPQLSKAASYYEREVGFQMKKATDLFQPTVILIVGGLVGFVAVAQVSAMYSIFGQVR
jgi:type IV pilus assembly protein PilC